MIILLLVMIFEALFEMIFCISNHLRRCLMILFLMLVIVLDI